MQRISTQQLIIAKGSAYLLSAEPRTLAYYLFPALSPLFRWVRGKSVICETIIKIVLF
jgi:hypothetical protein